MKKHIESYYQSLIEYYSKVDSEQLEAAVQALFKTIEAGGIIYVVGNGGSAATATHFVNDLIRNASIIESGRLNAVSLVDNCSLVTTLANDFCYNDVFERQLRIMMKPGDMLVAFSASGNSENILRAGNYTKSLSNTLLGITGFDGGELKKISDVSVHVDTPSGEYEKVEDIHLSITHVLSTSLRK